jgi:hypothetical protein
MDEERLLRKLAAKARAEPVPTVRVRAAVLAEIDRAEQPRTRLLWLFAGASAAAAVVAAVLAQLLPAARQDPFGEFLQSMMAVAL